MARSELRPCDATHLFDGVVHLVVPTAVVASANEAARSMLGAKGVELVGLALWDLFDADELGQVRGAWRQATTGVQPRPVELSKVLFSDHAGAASWGQLRLLPPSDGGHAVAIVRDVSARYQHMVELYRQDEALSVAIERLRQSEEKHRALVHAAEDAIMVCDLESGLFTEVNPAACVLFGYSEAEFRSLEPGDLHPAEAAEQVQQLSRGILVEGRSVNPRVLMQRRDGSVFSADLRMRRYEVVGRSLYVSIARDASDRVEQERQLQASVSELRETQSKLVESARLSAMGALAAGIAHELNQPLTAIEGFAQRIQRAPEKTVASQLASLDIIIREARRMAGIVENVKTFGREGAFEPRPIDASKPLDDAYTLIATQLADRGITVRRDTPPGLPRVNADSSRMQQVFLNLLLNARDALAELPPGERRVLTIRVGATPTMVCYQVEDTGPGVTRRVRERMFDPFFSTKATGSGTGLGLSITYAIIADHGGEIRCEDPPDGGARFVVELPTYAAD